MMVQVKLFGLLRLDTGVRSLECNVKTVEELLNYIPNLKSKKAKDYVVLVNGKAVSKNYRFQDSDKVVLMTPIGGG